MPTWPTAETAADALVNSLVGFEFDVERHTFTIDGLEGQVVKGVPCQGLSRVFLLEHDGRLYELTFTHDHESLGDKNAQMEKPFEIVTGSFQILC
jgi:hypothetical protein